MKFILKVMKFTLKTDDLHMINSSSRRASWIGLQVAICIKLVNIHYN